MAWLYTIGVPEPSIRAEYHTEDGLIDLYLTNRRVIIEVKSGGRLDKGPCRRGTGSKSDMSAYDQLDRYVRAERARERLYLEEDITDHAWLGALTDGTVWYVWEWDPRQSEAEVPRPIPAWQGEELNSGNLERLASLLNRESVGKEWATADMASEFGDVRHDLEKMYRQRRAMRSTKTQRGLWLDQLRGSGSAPEEGIDGVFVTHTMLILISRMISYSGSKYDEGKITEGFVQWVNMDGMDRLKAIIGRYNWRQHTGDILRSLYHHFIPEQHRKIYGEYYTPDWLAELMCQKVIDDGFVSEQLGRYNSGRDVLHVLDPSCGSGTFLYHAARRILGSDPVKNSGMEKHDAVRFVCGMIRGIDIHPVAVEMSRANLKRILPEAANSDIIVYQGDALLIQRPEARVLGAGGSHLPIHSPGNRHLVLPTWFVRSERDVAMFVETAKNDADMVPGLGSSLDGYDYGELLRAHGQMREIIRNEANGVWKWYILNQAGPLKLSRRSGRIVSNPPWVRYNKLSVESRQAELLGMAKDRKLWVGGDAAPGFDIASLFVDRCAALYMDPSSPKKSGWVLPQGSIKAKGWKGFRRKLGGDISCIWNLYRLPFANTPACVAFFGIGMERRDLRKIPGEKLNHYDTWNIASAKTEWAPPPPEFPPETSGWVDEKGKLLARNGATIFPYCFTHIERHHRTGRGIKVTTRRSDKVPWRKLGPLSGTVPEHWVHDCVSTENLLAYLLPTTTRCILPLSAGDWDPDRHRNKLWQDASDLYAAHHGAAKSTPQTLETRLDFNRNLFVQFGRTGDSVVYNTSGDNLYAARLQNRHIVLGRLFAVPCESQDEALFLESILNAEAMLPAFRNARKNDRDFVTHIWKTVPIPRYDRSNPLHRKLASLAERAERVAEREHDPGTTLQRNRIAIKQALADDGVSGQIDEICGRLMPRHVL